MQRISKNVIVMTLLLFVLTIIFSCAKDTDLLLDSVITESEISLEEKERLAEEAEELDELSENSLVSRTFTFSPTNDAYVQDEQGHDQTIIRLQEDVRTSYLMFDLSDVNGAITNAVLQFSVDSDEGDGSIAIHKGAAGNWTEDDLTIANAPNLDMQLGGMNKAYKVGAAEKVALDPSNLNAEITTLILTHSTGNDLAFASKEHPTNTGPQLIITYEAPADSPLIEQKEEESTQQETSQEETSQEETTQEQTTQDQPTPPNNNTASTEGAYYVTVNGNATNDGRSEATAWSIDKAFNTAIAGDIVYIKAGNYGHKELITDNSGTQTRPIKFIGYTNTPGDLVSTNGSTFNYGDQLDANKMPLIQGRFDNNIGTGVGISIMESYVHIENFQITKYDVGLLTLGTEVKVKNVIATMMGDFSLQNSYPTGTSDGHLNYSGNGIIIQGNSLEIKNCFVLNCGAEGISFRNTNNSLGDNNKVYSDNNINPTDYYFLLGSGTNNSTITNTTVFRVGALEHLGHGLCLKGNSNVTGNIVDGFHITNTLLEVQFPKVSNNTIKNGIIIKEQNVNVSTPEVGGIMLSNGSHHNNFEEIILTNCSIKFQDWQDGLAGDVSDSSDDNRFTRVTVKDSFSAISFSYFQVENHASSADNNVFEDCSFNNLEYLFEVDRANSNTLLKNCTINNVNQFKIERVPGGPSYSLDDSYQNCTWSNINFSIPN